MESLAWTAMTVSLAGAFPMMRSYFELTRTVRLADAARQWGLAPADEELNLADQFGHFQVFRCGHHGRTRNAMCGRHGSARSYLADHSYRTGAMFDSLTHHRTVCILVSDALDLPHSILRPQWRLGEAAPIRGGREIQFDSDPEFSEAYHVQGKEVPAVRELYGTEVRRFFLDRAGLDLQVETRGNSLLVHRGGRLDPGRAHDLQEEAFRILELWSREG